jgi:hypothetical protein
MTPLELYLRCTTHFTDTDMSPQRTDSPPHTGHIHACRWASTTIGIRILTAGMLYIFDLMLPAPATQLFLPSFLQTQQAIKADHPGRVTQARSHTRHVHAATCI